MAETYHVLDYTKLPVPLLATLTAGLRQDSRIEMMRAGQKVPLNLMLEASIADSVRAIVYGLFSDGNKPPESILQSLLNPEEKESDNQTFETGDDFLSARAKLIQKVKNNG